MRFIRFINTLVHLSIPVLMLLPVSCQAPRDNPFDPASPAHVPEGPPERINDLVLDDLIGLQCKLVWTCLRITLGSTRDGLVTGECVLRCLKPSDLVGDSHN